MKQIMLIGATLLTVASLSARAQATKSPTGAGNATNASTVGAATTNDPGSIGNDRIGPGQSGKRRQNRPGAVTGATVDGSNGSATNDGASGQSGSPAPLPAFSTSQEATKSSGGRKMKSRTNKTNRTANPSGGRSSH